MTTQPVTSKGGPSFELKQRRRWPWLAGAVVVLLILVGGIFYAQASHGRKAFGSHLKVATWSTDIAAEHLLNYIAKDVAPDYGITITQTKIDNLVEINRAVDDGDIAGNFFEHRPFLNDAIAANGFHLEQAAQTFTWDQASYSATYKSWDQVPAGASIGLRDDPAGQAIALLDLAESGQITLKPGHDTLAALPQLSDVASNPKHYKFVQIPIGQLARSLQDLDVIVVHISDVYASGLPDSDIIDRPKAPVGSEGGLTVSTETENDPNIQKLIKVFKDPRIQTYLKTTQDPIVANVLGPVSQ